MVEGISETGNLCAGSLLAISQRLRNKSSGMNVETSYFYSACFLKIGLHPSGAEGHVAARKELLGKNETDMEMPR